MKKIKLSVARIIVLAIVAIGAVMINTGVFTDEVYAAESSSDVISGTDGGNLTWTIQDGVLTISGNGDMADFRNSVGPFDFDEPTEPYYKYLEDETLWFCYEEQVQSVVIEEGVTSIGISAFSGMENITSVSIPSTVTEIGGAAFAETGITSVSIPDSVVTIGAGAFYWCSKLSTVELGSGIVKIAKYAFCGCTSLEKIEIPASVTTIAKYAFRYDSNLTEVTFEANSGLTTIGKEAFYGCHAGKVVIGKNVSKIGVGALSGTSYIVVDSANKYYTSVKGVLFTADKTELICYPADKEGTTYKIPKGTKVIAEEGFRNNGYLKKVTMANSVTTIGSHAFADMSSLKTVKFSSNLKRIENKAFDDTKLTSLSLPKSLKYIGKEAFQCDGLKGNIVIPENVTKLGQWAFYYIKASTKVIVKSEKLKSVSGTPFGAKYNVKKKVTVILPLAKKSAYQKIFTNVDNLEYIHIKYVYK